jgi:hypothetical protein
VVLLVNDVRVIFQTNRTVDSKGIDNHQCTNIDIGTVGRVIHTNKGPVIGIFHQYAILNKGSSIQSPCQFDWYKNDVNDKSNTYFERQDGTTTEDVIDQCIYATHMSTNTTEHKGIIFYDTFQTDIADAPTSTQVIIPKTTIQRSPDFQLLHPFFGWMSADIIQKTVEHTPQYA